MKMQVAGKIKLALCPFLNQWWHTAFYFNANGMTTGLIPYDNIIFGIDIDFNEHILIIRTDENKIRKFSLKDCTVAEFYAELMKNLKELGINVTINTLPSEVPNPVHCHEDTRSAYDEKYVHRWWKIQLQSKMIFERFRTSFRGKSSPVHFFWGSFDLNHTRFSGKAADPPEHSGVIMEYSENEENFSCGFWAGNDNYQNPAYYSYIYPAPKGITDTIIIPKEAAFDKKLGLFVLNYDDVRISNDPEKMILDFLNSTYEKSAVLAGWDIASLKAKTPEL
jgi:hypothetical protein